jgi:hypothetical protein
MTSIVGVLSKDGVVIGADSSVTFGPSHQFHTIEQPMKKLSVIADRILVAGTGQVGLDQRFCAVVKKAWDEKGFTGTALEAAKCLCKAAIVDFAETQAPKGQYGALVAFPVTKKFYLCEFSIDSFQPELKTELLWYCSMGSAQPITDPFLALMREFFWEKGPPSIYEAIFAVTWTLDHAIKVNPGGVNGPIQIGVLERTAKQELEARLLSDEELGEHRQNIEEAKKVMRAFRQKHQPEAMADLPKIPEP